MSYRLGSLFSGIGGLELGFEMTGEFETVFQVERDPWAQRVLAKHWPAVPRFDDVCTVGASNLPACDVLVGGFPCQDVSLAGLGAGLEGARSGLWWEFHRLIRELRPRIAVVENVPGLFTRGIDAVVGALAEVGYDAEWEVVSAASQGAPHIRERVFVVAYPEGERGRPGLRVRNPEGLGERGIAGNARAEARAELLADPDGGRLEVGGQPQPGGQQGARGSEPDGCGEVREQQHASAHVVHADGERCEEQHAPRVAGDAGRAPWRVDTRGGQWATEPAIRRVVDGVPRRVDRLRGLGNAVVPQVAYFVARKVLESGLLDDRMEVAA